MQRIGAPVLDTLVRRTLAHVSAAILAGGLGTRLRPAVGDRPKVLAEVHGRPFLSYLLDKLDATGIRTAVLCVGYGANQVKAAFGDRFKGLRLIYSREPEPLGTAGALRFALPHLAGDPVLALNGDSFCEIDLAAFNEWHCARGGAASLVLTRVDDAARYGNVVCDEGDRVLRFEEKPEATGPGRINAGIYLIHRSLIAAVPAGRAASLEQEMLPVWTGEGVYGFPGGGRFIDIGTPDSYAKAAKFFEPRRLG